MSGIDYFDVDRFGDPAIAPDGKRVAIRGRRYEDSDLYLVDRPGDDPRRLTDDEWIDSHGWHGSERLWYTTKHKHEIVSLDVETGQKDRTRIVTGETVEDVLPDDSRDLVAVVLESGPADDGQEREGWTVEIHRSAITGPDKNTTGTDDPVYAYPVTRYTSLVAWQPGRSRLLIKEIDGTFAHRLVLLDPETGDASQVTADSPESRYTSVQWGPRGEALYMVTDYGGDRLYVARLDPDRGVPEPVLEVPDWNVESVAVHESGAVLYAVNRDGESVIHVGRLTDPTTIEASPVSDLPSGVVSHAAFGPAGEKIAVTVSTETVPTSLYVLDSADGSAQRWVSERTVPWNDGIHENERDDVIHENERDDQGERISELVQYESVDGREIPALFSVPSTDRINGAVVDVHGGPEAQRRPKYRPQVRWFLDRGYAVLEPNVRGSLGYGRAYAALDDVENRPDAARDVAAAGRWIRSRPEIDVDTVVVHGHSHGGLLALVNAYRAPEVWNGVVSASGIYDLPTFIRSIPERTRYLRTNEYGYPDEHEALFETLSPIRNAEAVEVPTLVFHGIADSQVPVRGALEFVDRIEASGTRAELRLFEEEGHVIQKRENVATKLERIETFLDSLE